MAEFNSRLLGRKEVADGTTAFRFAKPSGFVFKSGQHIEVKLLNPPEMDAEGDTRTFSLVSTPQDTDLVVATRMRQTAFKNSLIKIPLNSAVKVVGPFGGMTLHQDSSKPAVLFAGGIGITPFMSIISDSVQRKLPHKIYLFYANRTPKDAPFLQDLESLQKSDQNFKLITTMTKEPDWSGEKGYITAEMVKKYVPDVTEAFCYFAGPPDFSSAIRKVLEDGLGVNPDTIRSEEFSGYGQ